MEKWMLNDDDDNDGGGDDDDNDDNNYDNYDEQVNLHEVAHMAGTSF